MKKRLFLLFALCGWHGSVHASADLIEIYQQALINDQTFQQAISQRLVTREGVPISFASLLPNISLFLNPSVTRSGFAGSNFSVEPGTGLPLSPRNNTQRYYSITLTATQTIFNFAQFANAAGAIANAKGADATLNAALQSLIIRVAKAYFAVLKDEDNVSYTEASKLAYAQQLDQVRQQYKVGLKTVTDVYTAQASYDSAVAQYIAAQTTLTNDRENLRVITGTFYPSLCSLSERFPLIVPQPENVEEWVSIAERQNWSIKAQQYAVSAARQNVRQQFAGHLPTVQLQGTLDRIYTNNINGYTSFIQRNGPGTETDKQIALNINVPIISGGGVLAQTSQATYNYRLSQEQLELTVRNTANTTRQSFLGVISGISQIKADIQAIKSNISSVEGMEASYRVGTETLVNVLNQRQKLLQAQTQYATDRYSFINNILTLKQSAGTLSFGDLVALNSWLIENKFVERERQKPVHKSRSFKKVTMKLRKRKNEIS